MNFSRENGTPVDILAESEALFRDVAGELASAMARVREGEFAQIKPGSQAVKDLRAAYQMVMEERTRVEKLRKQVSGAAANGALDFDAARDEIGRRLARLRDASGG